MAIRCQFIVLFYEFMIDSLITVIYFSDVTPSSDWDSHSPNFGFLTSFNNR